MSDNLIQEAAIALQQEWGIGATGMVSEETILRLLEARVSAILAQGAEPFYRLMYRLDISERKINALHGEPDAPAKIARLIYERQLQKIQSRRAHRAKSDETDPDLAW